MLGQWGVLGKFGGAHACVVMPAKTFRISGQRTHPNFLAHSYFAFKM